MLKFNTLQQGYIIPAGDYSMTIAGIGGKCLPDVQTLLQGTEFVSDPPHGAFADFIRLRTQATFAGIETQQYSSQVQLLSEGWKALAKYNWLISAQNTTVAFRWTMEAAIWCPTDATEITYWFWAGGLASRATIVNTEGGIQVSGSAVSWFMPTTAASSATMQTQFDPENVRSTWIAKLDVIAQLAPGWNRHGAPPPSEVAIRVARQFIEALVEDRQPPTRVAASAVGGVGVTRRVGDRLAYIEIYNDGVACALLADDTGDEQVLDVSPERGPLKHLLDEVKAYLDG